MGLVEAGASIAMASCFNLLSLRSMPILWFPAAAASLQSNSESDTSVVSDSVQPHRRQPTRLPTPGILQARTLEWVAISFSNA